MKTILFVCVENSCRSQIAEAFARTLGRGLIEAYSCGSRPSGHVNGTAIASMKELGYDRSTHASKSVSDIPQIMYDVVVTMGCGDACPSVTAKQREEWNIPDPKQMDIDEFRAVRDRIRNHVSALIGACAVP